jgi:peptidyl-prolyl cis-trans isomerase SurA
VKQRRHLSEGTLEGTLGVSAAMDMTDFLRSCRRLGVAVLVTGAAAIGPAKAQNVVAFVNGEPITARDVESRAKLIELSSPNHQVPARKQVIDELIDEKLQVREGRRWGIEISDSEVDSSFAYTATHNARLASADQFAALLKEKGVSVSDFKGRIRAQLVWPQLVRGRYQASLEIGEQDILAEMLNKKTDDDTATVGYEYTLRPILFIVPPGSPPSAFEDRKKEAEGLRNRFRSCDEGLPFARELREVNVREQIVRNSADLPPAERKLLDSIPVGQLSPPDVTKLGIEMHAVCSKTQAKADNSPGKRQARETIFNAKFQQLSKRYLAELRRAALIEYR